MKVLIGYDGSSHADSAVDDLQSAGLPGDVEALVVTVGELPLIAPLASHNIIERAFVGERVISIVEHANRQVAEALEQSMSLALNATSRLKSFFPSWHVQTEALTGRPAAELIRRANVWGADLIVVGSQGRSALGRFILGSVSTEVAGGAHCSVRIGRRNCGKTDPTTLRVLVGSEGSSGVENAPRKALQRAWPIGTELRIVIVGDVISSIAMANLTADGQFLIDPSTSSNRAFQMVADGALRVSAGVVAGDPRSVLLLEAQEWQADCLVIGSRTAGDNVRGFFETSVATELAANAECSVEIIR